MINNFFRKDNKDIFKTMVNKVMKKAKEINRTDTRRNGYPIKTMITSPTTKKVETQTKTENMEINRARLLKGVKSTKPNIDHLQTNLVFNFKENYIFEFIV